MNKPVRPEAEPSIFDDVDEAAEDQALREAEADYAAGRVVSNDKVMRWLETWGKPNRPPPPKCDE